MADHVLVLQDDDEAFELIERAMGPEFSLVQFPTLGEGLDLVQNILFDLILLDLDLPDSAGFSTFEAMHAAATQTPILIITDTDDAAMAAQAMLHGAHGYIPKCRLEDFPLARTARFAINCHRFDEAARTIEEFDRHASSLLEPHTAILDEHGIILSVNEGWRRFGQANGLIEADFCIGTNYLHICDRACGEGIPLARAAADGIREVLGRTRREFYLQYPCHSIQEQRWFILRAASFDAYGPTRVVIQHVRMISD